MFDVKFKYQAINIAHVGDNRPTRLLIRAQLLVRNSCAFRLHESKQNV